MRNRCWLSLALCLLCCLACCALAEEEPLLYAAPGLFENGKTITWRDIGVQQGAVLPVYSAPDVTSWRGASGRAAVSTNERFTLLCVSRNRQWCLIEYSISRRERRVGWIQASPEETDDADVEAFTGDHFLLRTTSAAALTDDPLSSGREIRRLEAGEEVIGLCLEGAWAYVETTVEGKTAWGFVPVSVLERVPMYHLEGTLLVVEEGVSWLGSCYALDRWDSESEALIPAMDSPPFGTVALQLPDLALEEMEPVTEIRLPSSLRVIGVEALCHLSLQRLELPEGLERTMEDAGYALNIGTLAVPAGCVDISGLPGAYGAVASYEVAEESRVYSSRDGVLFNRDGSVLIAYPMGRTEAHYDVPAGTKEIADCAFYSNDMRCRLKSISLPLGLERIGRLAFSGCGRLLSLVVPLTVTELAEDAFTNCVSLGQLSLPEGLRAAGVGSWAIAPDYSRFFGDNGETGAGPASAGDEEGSTWIAAWLDNPEGSGAVYAYASRFGSLTIASLPVGTEVWLTRLTDGRYYAMTDSMTAIWVEAEHVMICSGNALFDVWDEPAADVEKRLGILYDEAGKAIWLLDQPCGAGLFHTYTGEQAEVLRTSEGWLYVRTARGTGWVQEIHFRPWGADRDDS